MWKMRAWFARLIVALLGVSPIMGIQAHAYEKTMACMLVVEPESGRVLVKEGEGCATRVSPASTFKIPLAVMGFESGILENAHQPVWPYRQEYPSWRPSWKQSVDPAYWQDQSVVWFSQELTRRLGENNFQKYTDQINYGNRDLSGDPGKNNGMQRAWISSSLEISPEEQVAFMRKLVNGQLPVSAQAAEKAMQILPVNALDNGWIVHGKTGSGMERNVKGEINRERQFGWYVGWAEKDGEKVVFARLNRNAERQKGGMGVPTRNEAWSELQKLLN
ncbi:class D beta-lactamase [Brucella gallinifaecis]|uniref:Class D beta-lactamase n=1 Tax=Brucella gallinifaecis TaxID=215590 RepID=A0A502BRI6_9HYPH|nr:class D beta-lactamase [Brucella gallinifaecis]TPF76865.1 class D beta-lactamase [Brucella gallinifaecis]